MKYTALLLLGCMALFAACSGGGNDILASADRAAADSAGRRDAAVAARAASGTMERENTLFAIRARETRLRRAGYDAAADVYIAAAESVLVQNNVIVPSQTAMPED